MEVAVAVRPKGRAVVAAEIVGAAAVEEGRVVEVDNVVIQEGNGVIKVGNVVIKVGNVVIKAGDVVIEEGLNEEGASSTEG